MEDEKNSFGPWDDGPWCARCGTWHAVNAPTCGIVTDAQPLTTDDLIEAGFEERPETYYHREWHLTGDKFDGPGYEVTGFPDLLNKLIPKTKGQLRRLLALLADIQASLEGEEGQG